jgi:hypothetical protein
MKSTAFDVPIGLRLAIVRRAADMLVVHFGDIRAHSSGDRRLCTACAVPVAL